MGIKRCREYGRGGVAWLWFDQDGTGINTRLHQLFGDDEAEIGICQHQRIFQTGGLHAACSSLKQALPAKDIRELFRKTFA